MSTRKRQSRFHPRRICASVTPDTRARIDELARVSGESYAAGMRDVLQKYLPGAVAKARANPRRKVAAKKATRRKAPAKKAARKKTPARKAARKKPAAKKALTREKITSFLGRWVVVNNDGRAMSPDSFAQYLGRYGVKDIEQIRRATQTEIRAVKAEAARIKAALDRAERLGLRRALPQQWRTIAGMYDLPLLRVRAAGMTLAIEDAGGEKIIKAMTDEAHRLGLEGVDFRGEHRLVRALVDEGLTGSDVFYEQVRQSVVAMIEAAS